MIGVCTQIKFDVGKLNKILAELDMQVNQEELVDSIIADDCMLTNNDTCDGA